jgi:hypothetical protein
MEGHIAHRTRRCDVVSPLSISSSLPSYVYGARNPLVGEIIVTMTTGTTTNKTNVSTYLYYAVAKNTDNPKWNLTDTSADLLPGQYTLHYDFKGAPYCTLSISISSGGVAKPTTVDANAISDGTGWGNVNFEVL